MRMLILAAMLAVLGSSAAVAGTTWVDGYTRSNGTYVGGHLRTTPNSTTYDNVGCIYDGRC